MLKINSFAPGRLCLFGDHQDYIGLPIIACAIDRGIQITATPNDKDLFFIDMPDIDKRKEVPLALTSANKGDYLEIAIVVLNRYGCIPRQGYDVEVSGNLPINAGASSSSALIVAWVNFLLNTFGANQTITKELVSQIAYETEVLEEGAPGGKMDQYSIGLGNTIFLETGEPTKYQVFNQEIKGLILAESGVPKETNAVLKELKTSVWKAIDLVKSSVLDFDISRINTEQLDYYLKFLPEVLKPYFQAAVLNHAVTRKALKEFEKGTLDYRILGDLMSQHHTILRDLLNLTVPRIDNMIEAAMGSGAYGAKIMGSGRGGSIVVLSPEDSVKTVIDALYETGAKGAYAVKVDKGARVLKA